MSDITELRKLKKMVRDIINAKKPIAKGDAKEVVERWEVDLEKPESVLTENDLLPPRELSALGISGDTLKTLKQYVTLRNKVARGGIDPLVMEIPGDNTPQASTHPRFDEG